MNLRVALSYTTAESFIKALRCEPCFNCARIAIITASLNFPIVFNDELALQIGTVYQH